MPTPHGHYAQWNKPGTERQTQGRDVSQTETEHVIRVARSDGRESRRGKLLFSGYGDLVWDHEKVLEIQKCW